MIRTECATCTVLCRLRRVQSKRQRYERCRGSHAIGGHMALVATHGRTLWGLDHLLRQWDHSRHNSKVAQYCTVLCRLRRVQSKRQRYERCRGSHAIGGHMALVATHGRTLWGLDHLLRQWDHSARPSPKSQTALSPPVLCKYPEVIPGRWREARAMKCQ